MFEASRMMYLYAETSMHPGAGSGLGVVDLPIQRERTTEFPLVAASGIKGKLRAEASAQCKGEDRGQMRKKVAAVFGPEPDADAAHDHAGALSPGDARLLLFPVRSLSGVFAYTTCPLVLERLRRDLAACGVEVDWTTPVPAASSQALTTPQGDLVAGDKVVLEESAFTAEESDTVKALADWLANKAFPTDSEFAYFREKLGRSLAVLPDDAFRDFVKYATEVITRIRIDPETGTVAHGALWTQELLPADSLLYTPLHATRVRSNGKIDGLESAEDVLCYVAGLGLDGLQIGGDETVGRGLVKVRFGGDRA